MTPADVPQALALLNTYLEKFALVPQFTPEEFSHWLLPRPAVVDTFVVENQGKITDMCSFYHLPSTVIRNEKHPKLNAVYSFYNVATSMPLQVKDTLVMIN